MQYLRYTIVHHDVREHFGLTICEYMVCDSIHQLSHGAPTKQPNVKIAKHLGIDEGSVRNAKKKLVEKGVIAEVDGGFTSTEKWNHFVTFRKNSEPIRKNSESLYIYKDNKTTEATASEEIRVVEETEGEQKPKKKGKLTPEGRKVFDLFGGSCHKFVGVRPHEIEAANFLASEFSMEALQSMVSYIKEHEEDEFFYSINTPYALRVKFPDLKKHKNKYGN